MGGRTLRAPGRPAAPTPTAAPGESGGEKPQPAAPTASQATPPGNFWPGLVAGLKGKIPMGEYSFLSNPEAVQGTAEGGVLTLWVKDEFTRKMLNKPGILAAIQKGANLLPGAPYRAAVTVGQAPKAPAAGAAPAEDAPAADGHDKLDDLRALGRQFGDIFHES